MTWGVSRGRIWPVGGLLFALAASAAAVGAGQTTTAPREPLSVAFDDSGLSGLKFGQTQLLTGGQFRVARVAFEKADGNMVNADLKNPAVSFDPAARRLSVKYAWGSVACRYQPKGDRLDLSVTLQNGSQETIAIVALNLMEVQFPELPRGIHWEKGWPVSQNNIGSPTVLAADCNALTMAVCNEDIDRPLTVSFSKRKDLLYGLTVNAGGSAIVYDGLTTARPIPPGKSDAYALSLRFAPAGARPADLAEDLCGKFAAACPSILNWPDRRPINRVILCQNKPLPPTNPRKWFGDAKLDVTTEPGRADFKDRMLKQADRIVAICKEYDCQGVIVWDIEGEEHDRITYVGDPNSLPVLAPEMDAVADEFFKRFADARLRTGVCIRPTMIVSKVDPNSGAKTYSHAYGLDPDLVGRLSDKIAYAKKRWSCSLFYVDTNVVYRPGKSKEDKWQSYLIRDEMFRKIMEKHPDVLIVPEHEYTAYWACTAPYNELRMNVASTPALARKAYPRGFSVISVDDGDFQKFHDALVRAVREGDVLMFNGWYKNKAADEAKAILQEAKGK